MTEEMKHAWQQEFRNVASGKFFDDFIFIFEKIENNKFARIALSDLVCEISSFLLQNKKLYKAGKFDAVLLIPSDMDAKDNS